MSKDIKMPMEKCHCNKLYMRYRLVSTVSQVAEEVGAAISNR
jgi:hypothetical protein